MGGLRLFVSRAQREEALGGSCNLTEQAAVVEERHAPAVLDPRQARCGPASIDGIARLLVMALIEAGMAAQERRRALGNPVATDQHAGQIASELRAHAFRRGCDAE